MSQGIIVCQKQVADILWNLTHIIPLAIFVFVVSLPTEALAWAQDLSTSSQPLVFIRDPSLANEAIVGIEAFSAATVGGVLSSRASTIRPVIIGQLWEGSAIRVLAFAYSSSSHQTDADPFTTASGGRVQPGTMAANFLPFGSQVRVGNVTYTVQDRMNERYNNKYVVDLWQPTYEAAIAWGARVVEMEIVALP